MQNRKIGISHWAFLSAGVVLGSFLSLAPHAMATDVDATYRKLRVFSQVLTYIQGNYVDVVASDELVYDAIGGMLRDLDPHSAFMRPEEYRKLREDTAGEFGGLGLALVEEKGRIYVEEVFENGAALRAGMLVGDEIVAVADEKVRDLSMAEVVKRLRGIPGTKVELSVQRDTWPTPRKVPLVRKQIRVPSIQNKLLEGDIAYLRIRSFQERTDHDFAAAIAALRKDIRREGRKDFAGMVIDLRDNPGGLLDEGVKVADRFISKGKIVSTVGRNPHNAEVQLAHREGTEKNYPLTVLVNGGSASASEILAGALQDHKRATLIGTSTYGKGSVQTLFGLDDGAGLKLTIARYLTPNGRSIQEKGLEPDILVDVGNSRIKYADTHTDKALQRAIKTLRQD